MSLSSIYPNTAFNRQPLGYPLTQQLPQSMSINMPLGMFQQPPKQNNELVGLHGLDSAKQFTLGPNMTAVTFDMDSDHAFIHNTDANGVMSIKILQFHVVTEEEYRKATESESPIQMTKGEYEELTGRLAAVEEELKNAKQLIRERDNSAASAYSAAGPTAKLANKPAVSNDGADVQERR